MAEPQKKDLTNASDVGAIPTDDELRILQNLRNQAARWPHGRFGPVSFITHNGQLKHGIFSETENIETRI